MCTLFWYQNYLNQMKNKASVIFKKNYSEYLFFVRLANSDERIEFKKKKLKKHSFLNYYPIWINFVPK